MVSWLEGVQSRFSLDYQFREVLIEIGINPETRIVNIIFAWPTESYYLFAAMSDFRADLLHQSIQTENTTCLSKSISFVKVIIH